MICDTILHYLIINADFIYSLKFLGSIGMLCIICGIYALLEQKEYAFVLIKNVCMSYGGSTIIKEYLHCPRPFVSDPSRLLVTTKDYLYAMGSFPSGHTAVVTAIFMTLFMWYRKKTKLAYLFLVPIIIVAFSRVFIGCHHMVDVVGGFLLGLAVVYFCTDEVL